MGTLPASYWCLWRQFLDKITGTTHRLHTSLGLWLHDIERSQKIEFMVDEFDRLFCWKYDTEVMHQYLICIGCHTQIHSYENTPEITALLPAPLVPRICGHHDATRAGNHNHILTMHYNISEHLSKCDTSNNTSLLWANSSTNTTMISRCHRMAKWSRPRHCKGPLREAPNWSELQFCKGRTRNTCLDAYNRQCRKCTKREGPCGWSPLLLIFIQSWVARATHNLHISWHDSKHLQDHGGTIQNMLQQPRGD